MRRHPVVALAAVLALALPSFVAPPALAQSAGDEQYVDPFEREGGGGGGSGGGSGDGGETGEAPTGTAPPETSAPAPTLAQVEPGTELPRTGAPAGLLAGAGASLLAAGAALRRRF